jgi:hypothetical protein
MRWLFLFVLLLNIVYVVWQTSVPAQDTYANVPRLDDVEPIVLIRELVAGRGDGSENLETETAVIKDELEDNDVVAAVAAAENEKCFTLGPFREKENVKNLKKEISSYVDKAAIRDHEEREHTVHWVYIQPEKDRKSVINLGKRLKSKKIKDFYVIREGEKNNGISLGHFKDKARAFGLESKVKKLGFDVMVEPIYKTFVVFWLDYQLIDDDIPESVLKKYMHPENGDKVSRLSRNCQS